ncbi:MAG: hypothetical protein VCA55_12570 [Verrucomicrobiales bacterium]
MALKYKLNHDRPIAPQKRQGQTTNPADYRVPARQGNQVRGLIPARNRILTFKPGDEKPIYLAETLKTKSQKITSTAI